MKADTQLLIIDPQNDFCDVPADWCPVDPLTGATGFEAQQAAFLDEMRARGVRTMSSSEALALLRTA